MGRIRGKLRFSVRRFVYARFVAADCRRYRDTAIAVSIAAATCRHVHCVYGEKPRFEVQHCALTVAAAICRHVHRVYEGKPRFEVQHRTLTVAAAFKAAMGEAYTRRIALNDAAVRIHNAHGGVDAAATDGYVCFTTIAADFMADMGIAFVWKVRFTLRRFVYARFMAAGCRRYGGGDSPFCCFLFLNPVIPRLVFPFTRSPARSSSCR